MSSFPPTAVFSLFAALVAYPVPRVPVYSPPSAASGRSIVDSSIRVSSATSSPARARTPITHLVVIFQENVSFDHYFATYPRALNPPGEPKFAAALHTPTVHGLRGRLLTHNPNLVQPFRLARRQSLTCDMNHSYRAEQQAFDERRMDGFVQWGDGKAQNSAQYCPRGTVMGYYDGNTVTALWNYAQSFAMDDNAHGTTFGPSTVGALNLVAGDTGASVCAPYALSYGVHSCSWKYPPRTSVGNQTKTVALHDDVDPYYDDCSVGGPKNKSLTAAVAERNIGDMLNAADVTWGWFAAGFGNCRAVHPVLAYDAQESHLAPSSDHYVASDYDRHQEPFQYFASTSNPHHLPPTTVAMIGHTDQANHQYDITDFWAAADAGNMPAVAFLKAPGYETGHPGYSDPLDEQAFLVHTVNRLERLPSWKHTAIVITYDDSDGWYDHVRGKIINHSATPFDFHCGSTSDGVPGRCGYGPRLPYLIVSPYARKNFVDHSIIDQTSTLRFIEDNWLGGQRVSSESFDNRAGSINAMFDFHARSPANGRHLYLDPITGYPLNGRATRDREMVPLFERRTMPSFS